MGCLTIRLPEGKYQTVLADPAWSYTNEGVEGAAAEEYPTMSLDDICKMPVAERADEDAVLLLWTTNPLQPEAHEVVKAWDFRYKTMFTWVKNTYGTGFWLRGMTEHCFVATRGKPPLPVKPPRSVYHFDNPGHSAKPREFYPVYESIGTGNRLELFARQRRHGWTSWGNQLSKTVETPLSAFTTETKPL